MTLTAWQGVVMLAAASAFGLLGWAARRPAAALVPLTAMVLFTAAMVGVPSWYERVPEDVQAMITFSLALGALGAFVGALARRSMGPNA